MEILIKVAQAVLAFTLLIGIHEFGHYISARIFGMRVDKFYILFDPWFSIFKFKKGDTEYGLGWLPLGGYCKIAGMVDESMDKEQLAQPPKPYEFRSKPAWQRLIVMLAGVTLNVVFAVFIYIGISFAWGESYLPAENAKWGYNFSESAESIGFKDGDKVISIDGEKIEEVNDVARMLILSGEDREVILERDGEQMQLNIALADLIGLRKNRRIEELVTLPMPFVIDSVLNQNINNLRSGDEILAVNQVKYRDFSDFRQAFSALKNQEVDLRVARSLDTLNLSVLIDAEGKIGVYPQNPYKVETRDFSFFEAIPAGFRRTGDAIGSYWEQLTLIFQPKSEMYRELGGFVAIGNMFGSEWNWHDFWVKCAFLSIMLAVLNVLPIPGLDGAHSLFAIFEIVTGKKPSEKFLEIAQYIGLILLLMLMLYANGNDFYRLFSK